VTGRARRGRGSARRGAALAALVVALGAARPAGADEVELRFDWPVGLTARVVLAARVQDASGRRGDTTTRRVAYRMRLEEAKDGLLVRFSEPELLSLDNRERALLRLLPAFQPSLVIDARGRLVRLVELDEMRESFRRLVDDPSPEVLAIYEERTAPEAARAAVQQRWQLLAADWLPSELELGAHYQAESQEPAPLGGVPMPVDVRWSASKRLPCRVGENEPRCVEILYQSLTDQEAFDEILEQHRTDDAPKWKAVVLKRIRLVSEPDGLVPHRADLLQRERILVEGRTPVLTDRHYIWVFDYADRADR